jgi:crotonobetainyl-CoA:carnitine CoA-transferase CaiB-like acyl-CoA transferase
MQYTSLNKPFKDLKVVELASVLAGPAVGMFFAELGAKVIKVENKISNGDVTRTWRLPEEHYKENVSAYFYSVNYGKKHLFLDIRQEKDYKALIQEIKKADIVICNYKKGDDKKLKVDFNHIKKVNPKIIYAAISGFGEESDRVAFDLVLQAESGFMSMNGTPESGPVKMPVAMIDLMAAHQLKEGILTALLIREKNKKAIKINVSLYDSAIASLANQASNWLIAKHNPQRMGSLHPNIAPYGEIYKTADGKSIVLAIGSESQFTNLLLVLKLQNQKAFSSNAARVENRKKLFEILQEKIINKNLKWLSEQFTQLQIPYGEIKDMKAVFKSPSAGQHLLKIKNNPQLTIPKTVRFKLSV